MFSQPKALCAKLRAAPKYKSSYKLCSLSKAEKCWHGMFQSECVSNKYNKLSVMGERGKNVRNLIYSYIRGEGNPAKIETP